MNKIMNNSKRDEETMRNNRDIFNNINQKLKKNPILNNILMNTNNNISNILEYSNTMNNCSTKDIKNKDLDNNNFNFKNYTKLNDNKIVNILNHINNSNFQNNILPKISNMSNSNKINQNNKNNIKDNATDSIQNYKVNSNYANNENNLLNLKKEFPKIMNLLFKLDPLLNEEKLEWKKTELKNGIYIGLHNEHNFRNGRGAYIYDSDNSFLIGNFINGKREGKFYEYNSDFGLVFDGFYKEGKRNGKGII